LKYGCLTPSVSETKWLPALKLVLALVVFLMSLPAYARSEDRVVMVEFRDSWAEVFVTFPASDLNKDDIHGLLTDGGIDMVALRDRPDDLAQGLIGQLKIGPDGAPLEAMSMMAHPLSEPYPYATPYDAILAASVCGVPDQVRALPVDDTRIYLSLYHDLPDGLDQVVLDLSFLTGLVELRVFGAAMEPSVQEIDSQAGPAQVERPASLLLAGTIKPALALAFLMLAGAGLFVQGRVSRHSG